ncbi:MAG: dienelactone hydrolase family protein [Rhizomicrobium sp.]
MGDLSGDIDTQQVNVGARGLPGTLRTPRRPLALIIFAHGSGSSRLSPRNVAVAEALNEAGFATLLFDLLSPQEESEHNRAKVFDIPLLAARVGDAVQWAADNPSLQKLPIGLFGASTGAAAALVAAARMPSHIRAVVSRGGRPDMAGDALPRVAAPTLLIVGGADHGVIELNQEAYETLRCTKKIEIVPGATHLFSESGAMERVVVLATRWFQQYLQV